MGRPKSNKPTSSTCTKCGYIGDNFNPSKLNKCKECLNEEQRIYRSKRPKEYWKQKDFQYAIKKRYGLSVDGYSDLFELFQGRCAACREPAKLSVDHEHSSGLIRGLLCNGCNRALGFVDDDIDKLIGLAEYLIVFLAFKENLLKSKD